MNGSGGTMRASALGIVVTMAIGMLTAGCGWAAAAPQQAVKPKPAPVTVANRITMEPPLPEAFFTFKPGADRELFDYTQLIDYLKAVDATSERLTLVEIGRSPMGRPMYLAVVSAAENIRRLDELKAINRRLALDPDIPPAERDALVARGRVFVLATLSMHSSEVAPSQMLPLYVYDLVTARDAATLKILDETVQMFVPCHNPDGMQMVVEHYRKHKGTRWEGSDLPGVYHKYVGHDNNRDFVALTQSDTRAVNRIFSTDWFPQVMIEKHQMGETGPRFFVPPNHDPIAENVDRDLWYWCGLFGANMAKDMGAAGLRGVAQHWGFDQYWPGSTETCLFKNVIAMLTENASCRVATPVYVEPTELGVRGKGLAEYKKSTNMPDPWPGGWWRLGDMVQYELVSMRAVARTAAENRAEILAFRNELCRREVERGRTQAPYAYILPLAQSDRSELAGLANLLLEHGVRIYRLTAPLAVDGCTFGAGDLVVPLAQAYRPLIKELMEDQRFPVRHYTPGGELIRPYDITSWSLPRHRGVRAVAVNAAAPALAASLAEVTGAFRWPGAGEVPADATALAWAAGDNDAFRAAFRALAAGLLVQRLTADTTVGDATLPAGSFVIMAPPGQAGKLRDVAAAVAVPPVRLEAGTAAAGAPPLLGRMAPPLAAETVTPRRIALVETWFHDMDAGWTRYVLDDYRVPYTVLRPGDFETTDLARDFDVVIFPDSDKNILMTGQLKAEDRYYMTDMPAEFTKGMGPKGMERLMSFLDKGGVILAWGRSTALFAEPLEIKRGEETEKFQLPVRLVSDALRKDGLYVPGAGLRVALRPDSPLTVGMPAEVTAFSRAAAVFATSVPDQDMDRRVAALYPEEDILVSGYAERVELLGNRPAVVWLRKGRGQLALYGFNPQHRGSTPATFKLLFNGILLPPVP